VSTLKHFGLIIIGDEILSGMRQDKHLSKCIEILSARGLQLSWVEYIGDHPERITATLGRAYQAGDIVFCTGGVGSTPDDHTRACAAQAFQAPLQRHPDAAQLILNRIAQQAKEKGVPFDSQAPFDATTEIRLQMADFPTGARLLPNPYNQIAGFSWGDMHFVPGFPVMAWPMMEWVLDTYYVNLFHQGREFQQQLIVSGAHEARLTPLMCQIQEHFPGVKVFSLPNVDHPQLGPHIELGVKGEEAQQVEEAFAYLKEHLDGFL
jgi:molybdopterin-biosynthesis enzyme MoeA-like protein